jgi:aminoglycoside 3-N-acetyltransferase I
VSERYAIRRLGRGEIGIAGGLNALFGEAFEDPDTYGGRPPDDGYLAELLGKEHVVVLVATAGDGVVGGLVAYELDKLEQARREIYLYDLAVHSGHRRQGIATRLIERLCRIASERGAWAVFVEADHGDDPAIALYTKLGTREDVLHFDIAPSALPGFP